MPDSILMCRGTQGLCTKIEEVLKKDPSTFRFWLSSSDRRRLFRAALTSWRMGDGQDYFVASKQMDSVVIRAKNILIDSDMFIRANVLAWDHLIQAGGEHVQFG